VTHRPRWREHLKSAPQRDRGLDKLQSRAFVGISVVLGNGRRAGEWLNLKKWLALGYLKLWVPG
jgi:hypothetical protein